MKPAECDIVEWAWKLIEDDEQVTTAFELLADEIGRLRDERLAFATESEERKAEVERLQAINAWLKERLRDAVNTCYGGTTHDEITRRALEPKP